MADPTHSTGVDSDILLANKHLSASSVENTSDRFIPEGDRNELYLLLYIKSFKSVSLWQWYIVLSIIYISGIIANTILLTYLLYYKRYRAPVFCVILSLCISDLGVCVASLLWLSTLPFLILPQWMCNAVQTLLYVSYLSSTYHMVVFAALRFFQLVYPLASRAKITVNLLTRVCLLIWALDIIQAFIWTCFFEPVERVYMNERIYICLFTGDKFVFMIWILSTWLLAPFLVTSGFHFSKHIIVLYKRSASKALVLSSDADQQRRKETGSRALAIVISLYLISILPTLALYLRTSIILFSIPMNVIEVILPFFSEQIAFINSSINPWIYMFAAESVRSDIRKVCVRVWN